MKKLEDQDKKVKLTNRVIIFLSLIITILSAYILLTQDLVKKPLAGQENIQDNVQIGGEFTLIDQDGNRFSSQQMHGKLSLVYFGFTYCPDICPNSLNKLSNVISTLDKYQIDVLPIFITVDPERDSPELLKEYLRHFHRKFLGLSGSKEEIKHVSELYKVFYAKSPISKNSSGGYMVDHSSFIYLIGKDGKYLKHFYSNSTEEDIIQYIRLHK